MFKLLATYLALLSSLTLLSQNLTSKTTVDYIETKMLIADPMFDKLTLGPNGETVIKWANKGVLTEYRFNIREVEFNLYRKENGDNYLQLTCSSTETGNCMQKTSRVLIDKYGDDVSYDHCPYLTIESVAGFANITSIKNALKYLKIISIEENEGDDTSNKDPFLY